MYSVVDRKIRAIWMCTNLCRFRMHLDTVSSHTVNNMVSFFWILLSLLYCYFILESHITLFLGIIWVYSQKYISRPISLHFANVQFSNNNETQTQQLLLDPRLISPSQPSSLWKRIMFYNLCSIQDRWINHE